ncbi:MAG: c-type cytochrome [Acidobacteria bacterium]|nr:c-type cytochrome [Acidobacteriota bacterium]MCL5286456.1 c-type cytochrome [Acidobacteriota bacterium]
MNRKSKGFVFVMALLALAIGAALAGAQAQSGTTQQAPAQAATEAPKPKVSEEVFKNIQVLKGVPEEQWQATMQYMATSLGVECNFCHVGNAREKDDKKQKQVARKMIEMTRMLNKDVPEVEGHVTCYSCHRGAQEPVFTPPVADENFAPPARGPAVAEGAAPAAPTAPQVTVDQIIEKYVQALGGAEAIQKITSRVSKGALEMGGGRQSPIEIYAKAPDKRISVMRQPNGRESLTAYDGKMGWLGGTGQPVREMNTAETAAARFDADLHFAAHVKKSLVQLRVVRPEKIGDREMNVVIGRMKGQPPMRLYFDKETGLMMRVVRFVETALGRLPTQIDYADYRDADGVKVPFRWTIARPNGRFTIQLEAVQQNVRIDDARFAAPPAPAPTEQKPPTP